MDKATRGLYRTAETRLIRRRMTSREQITHTFNRNGTIGIDGIGPRLAKLIEDALSLPDAEWCALFPRIPTGRATMPVELSPVQGARVEWQPSEALLEGAGGMAVEGHSLTPPAPEVTGKPCYHCDGMGRSYQTGVGSNACYMCKGTGRDPYAEA